MSRRRALSLGLLVSSGLTGCRQPVTEEQTTLPAGVVALVGEEPISVQTVERIGRAQGVSPVTARQHAIRDALWASAARQALPAATLSAVERRALARAQLEALEAAARRQGLPTDAEIAALTALRFYELDRPRAVRVLHVVLQATDPDAAERAARLAAELQPLLRAAPDVAAFRRIAEAAALPEGVNRTVEALPPITADGRSLPDPSTHTPPGAHFDEVFAKAAAALTSVGATSPVTVTPFGHHVLRATEIIPSHHVPLARRRELLAPEIYAERAASALHALLTTASAQHDLALERGVDELTARVTAAP